MVIIYFKTVIIIKVEMEMARKLEWIRVFKEEKTIKIRLKKLMDLRNLNSNNTNNLRKIIMIVKRIKHKNSCVC